MSAKVTTAQGLSVPVYRNVGHIVIGTDEDFTDCIELEIPSFLTALEALGFAVIPLEATA